MSNSPAYYRLLNSGSTDMDWVLVLNDVLETRLQVLTDIAQILGVDDLRTSSYLSAMAEQSTRELTLRRTLLQLRRAENILREHAENALYEEKLIQKWIEAISNAKPRPRENVAAVESRTNSLAAKAREYQKELDEVTAQVTGSFSPTATELVAERESLRKKEHELKLKRAKIQAYQGLPPNIELARLELREAEHEHKKLIDLRERLLANIAASVS